MRVGLGGLLTPDGCIEEVAVPGMVAHQRYRLRSLAFTSPGSGIVLVWVVVLVSSVVAGVRTWWWHGGCGVE